MRTLVSLLLVAAVAGLGPRAAEAACTQTGTMIQVKMKPNDVKGSHVLFLRAAKEDTFYYAAKTTDDTIAAVAANLAALQTRVRIKGNASKCPSAGSNRNMGKVVEVVAVP